MVNGGQAVYEYNTDGMISSVKVFFYSPNGDYDGNRQYVVYRYSYDDSKNLTGVEMIDVDGVIRQIATYAYDDKQHLVKEKYAAPQMYYNEFTLYVSEYSYNERGDIETIEQFYGADYDGINQPKLKTRLKVEYEYDNTGKLITRSYYDRELLCQQFKCEYDEDGKLSVVTDDDRASQAMGIYEYHYRNGSVDTLDMTYGSLHIVFRFDEIGNVVRRENSDGSYIVYEYEQITLPANKAARCKRVQWLRDSKAVSSYNIPDYIPRTYDVRNEYLSLVAYPMDILYQIDIWGR